MMGDMFTALKGGSLWAALVVLLAIIGSVTYLASSGYISGSDALTVVIAILTAVTGVTSAHVAGQTAAAAFNTPAPTSSPPPLPPPAVSAAPGVMP
jgi:hypothetical protein